MNIKETFEQHVGLLVSSLCQTIYNSYMKKNLLLAFLFIGFVNVNGQMFFKTEYIGKSNYRMTEGDTDTRVGNSKGSALIHQGGINIPISMKLDANKRPTMWGVSGGGAYVKLDNKNFVDPLVIDEIMNLSLNLLHVRPLTEKWSMMAVVGGGVYVPSTRFSQIRFKHVLGNVGAIFIYHLKPNLELGGGVAMNNSFGYPMVFPAFYLNWRKEGRLDVKVAMMEGVELSAGYDVNKSIRLNVVAEMNGQMALVEQERSDKIFSHQYMVVGLQPEVKVGKYISIPFTAGISAMRPAEMTNRSLKSLFQDRGYYFQVAPYISVGLQAGF